MTACNKSIGARLFSSCPCDRASAFLVGQWVTGTNPLWHREREILWLSPLLTHFTHFFLTNSRVSWLGCWEILLDGVHNVQNPWVLSTAHIGSNCHGIRMVFHHPHSGEFLASVAFQYEPMLHFLSYSLLSLFSLKIFKKYFEPSKHQYFSPELLSIAIWITSFLYFDFSYLLWHVFWYICTA